MSQPTLFGDAAGEPAADGHKPRLMAPAWLVEELVALGVPRDDASEYTQRQAYAVRESVKKKAAGPKADPVARPDGENKRHLGATGPERWMVQDTLAADVAGYDAGTVTADDLYLLLRGSLYVLTPTETARVARGLVKLLAESDTRKKG